MITEGGQRPVLLGASIILFLKTYLGGVYTFLIRMPYKLARPFIRPFSFIHSFINFVCGNNVLMDANSVLYTIAHHTIPSHTPPYPPRLPCPIHAKPPTGTTRPSQVPTYPAQRSPVSDHPPSPSVCFQDTMRFLGSGSQHASPLLLRNIRYRILC